MLDIASAFSVALLLSAGLSFATASEALRPERDATKHWAVIIAGSRGYENYRHQADAANAYHLLIDKGGYLEDQVILMSVDDAVDDSENPFQGQLFNHPSPNATDVWVKPTYTGADVNADVFLGVLTGNTTATNGGPVLKSSEDDYVFIAYFDHGAPGLLGMPDGNFLYADRLNRTLTRMLKKKMAKSIALYVEACESGSMFDGVLTNNRSIYAVTAANPDESSWGWYCPPDDNVDGQSFGTCLGDLFSIAWLEDTYSRAANVSRRWNETLEDQYLAVQNRTVMSHVMQYGASARCQGEDNNDGCWVNGTDIWVFEGTVEPSASPAPEADGVASRLRRNSATAAGAPVSSAERHTGWNSREATIRSLVHRLNQAKAQAYSASSTSDRGAAEGRVARLQAELDDEVRRNRILKRAFDLIATQDFEMQQVSSEGAALAPTADLSSVLPAAMWASMAPSEAVQRLLQTPLTITAWDCYRAGIDALKASCTDTITDWGLQYLRIIGHVCEKPEYRESPVAAEQVERIVERACEMAASGVVF